MTKKTKELFKQLDDLNWSKWKVRSKRKNHGLKKGDGGLPESSDGDGISESLKNMFNSKSKFLNVEKTEDEELEHKEDDIEVDNDEVTDEELEGFQNDETGDEDKQGLIRVVKGAHLVYKRKNEEGRYEELWIFKIDDKLKNSLDIKNDILSGTDISPNKTKSEDGLQEVELWTAGNVQLLFITGLPQ